MSKPNNSDDDNNNDDKRSESSSIFFIMDGIIDQLNKTKKLFIIMLLTIMIIPPIAFMLSFMLFGFPFHDDSQYGGNNWWDSSSIRNDSIKESKGEISNTRPWEGPNSNSSFRYLPLIPIIVVLIWLGIGIRQWFVLSKWDKKYKKYKEMQKRIDEKLEKDENKDRT